MKPAPSRILIIGGNSSIATHLLTLIPDARALARTGGASRVSAVGDYRRIAPSNFEGIETVINCAGIVTGPEATLQQINVKLQASLAIAARDAGATRYISIGSFSIFGPCPRIDRHTATKPIDAYGRSKLDGDHALQRLQTDRFKTLSVALPTIVGTTRTGKVERMLRIWRQTGFWPVPKEDITRSMIGAEGAARVLARAASDDCDGRILAADPLAFSYVTVAQWLREDLGEPFALLQIPDFAARLLKWVRPSLHQSLLTDNMLEPSSNYAMACGLESSLRRELIADVIKGSGAR